jgi:hypothetical protein
VKQVGKQRLVLDLSCRKRDGKYYVVTDRWQRFSELVVDAETLSSLGMAPLLMPNLTVCIARRACACNNLPVLTLLSCEEPRQTSSGPALSWQVNILTTVTVEVHVKPFRHLQGMGCLLVALLAS